jgi:hypothetical protein
MPLDLIEVYVEQNDGRPLGDLETPSEMLLRIPDVRKVGVNRGGAKK